MNLKKVNPTGVPSVTNSEARWLENLDAEAAANGGPEPQVAIYVYI